MGVELLDEARSDLQRALDHARTELEEVEQRRSELAANIRRLETALSALGADPSPTPPAGGPRHVGKYKPLFDYLVARTGKSPTRLTFADVEKILGFQLPPSSRKHLPAWYGYGGSAVARAIIDAGWKASNVDLAAETLELYEGGRKTPAW
jgi:hypothetical protein